MIQMRNDEVRFLLNRIAWFLIRHSMQLDILCQRVLIRVYQEITSLVGDTLTLIL